MDRDCTLHEPGRASDATASKRWPWVLVLTARTLGAVAMIGTLSLFAVGAMRRHPSLPPLIQASATGFDPGLVFVPSVARSADLPIPAVTGGHLRLFIEGADPVRAEPEHGPSTDTISRGDFPAIEAPYLHLTLTRVTSPPTPSLFVTLARRAAEGLNLSVVRTGPRGRIETKFGPVETLEATLVGHARRICTGFTSLEAVALRIDGWLCAPLGQPPEPRALACTLDALSLTAGADAAADAVFAAAQHRRDPTCGSLQTLSVGDSEGRTGSIGPKRGPSSKKRSGHKLRQ